MNVLYGLKQFFELIIIKYSKFVLFFLESVTLFANNGSVFFSSTKVNL